MELSLITNDPHVAVRAEQAGIDRIFIDLERLGKQERQAGKGLFLSQHALEDVARIRPLLRTARLMVRVDPWHCGSFRQIDAVLQSGADDIMLPFFHRFDEAAAFVRLVNGRARPILLVETAEAAGMLGDLCQLPGLAEVHIGLNDLSQSLGKIFLFELLLDGTIERLCQTLRERGVPFGFGGIGSLSNRNLPIDPEAILAEQVCQGASRGWLGRTFRDTPADRLAPEIGLLRETIARWRPADPDSRDALRRNLHKQIAAEVQNRICPSHAHRLPTPALACTQSYDCAAA